MTDLGEQELVDEGAIPPDDFHDFIDRIREVSHYELKLPPDLAERLRSRASMLLIAPDLLQEAAAALAVGHLVLQGPPGTGKSTLARILCEAFGVDVLPVTAHEDWSTFEVIGRHELRVNADGQEEIVGVNGFFTEAAIRCAGSIVRHFDNEEEPQATWLLIDELNRAHPDKAFGELFTVLGTDDLVDITLLHQRAGNNVLVTPRRFRIVATLNAVDKQFVNSLSQGLRRRFTFLTVGIPPRRLQGELWGATGENASLASREFTVVSAEAVRRVVGRLPGDGETPPSAMAEKMTAILSGPARPHVEAVFDFAEKVRYATGDGEVPYVPIGTAPLIDTVELFLSRILISSLPAESYVKVADWAVSVKLVPLFDSDTVNRAQMVGFANALPQVFQTDTKRELLQIASDGLFYVG